jgi:hypothetical protein
MIQPTTIQTFELIVDQQLDNNDRSSTYFRGKEEFFDARVIYDDGHVVNHVGYIGQYVD